MENHALRIRATESWTEPIIAALRGRVVEAVARGVRIPAVEQISGWAHNFTCSRCAARIGFAWDMPGPFTCGACGNVDDGQDRREAWIYEGNLVQIQLAAEACVLGQVEDAPRAIDYAREVLLGYARRYQQWPEHGRWAGKGRLQAQSLDEAVWMLHACEAFDRLVALGSLAADERSDICDGMFTPAIALLRPQVHKVHNIHVWLSSALIALGERCADAATVTFARQHLGHNLERGVLADGSWYECSPHYHFYTCDAVLAGAEACRRHGTEIPGIEVLRRMVRSPLSLLKPDGNLALVNDGWPENPIAARAAFYEKADGVLGDCGDILGEIYRRGAQRNSLEALLHGPAQVPTSELSLPAIGECDGIVTVRRGGLLALVKSNPHGGGHDHRDQPTLDLHLLDGSLDAGDMGNPGYGNPLHYAWFKRTAAHNTVLVDGADHAGSRPRVLEAAEHGRFSVVRVRESGAVPGGVIVRTVVVGDGWVLDRVVVELPGPREVLWRFHARAAFACARAVTEQPRQFLANPHVTAQRELLVDDQLDGLWTSTAGGRLAVRVWRPVGGCFGAASAPALPATERVELLCASAHAARVVFEACFAVGALPSIGRTSVDGATRYDIAGTAFSVRLDGVVLAG